MQVLLDRLPPSATVKICDQFINLGFLSWQQQEELLEKISYNGRSVQYFLWRAWITLGDKTTEDVSYADLLQCVELAYQQWLGIIVNDKAIQQNPVETYTTLSELMLTLAYPAAVHGEVQVSGAVRFATAAFPQRWKEFACAGAFNLRSPNGQYVDVFPPKGFLYRWITEEFSKKVFSLL